MERQPCNTSRGSCRSAIAFAAALAMTLLVGFSHAAEPPPDNRELPLTETGAAVAPAEVTSNPRLAISGVGTEANPSAEAIATINAAVLPATVAAGRTPATFGVTHSGAATYTIPIWTPPGIGSLDLRLALVYSSRTGNGLMGQGWSLSGLSTISRCNQTWAQNGAPGAVANAQSDRFCLDGQQLKLVSGAYGAPGSVYATEIESFSRIVALGSAGAGPASFIVTTRQGLVYEYGGTTDARIFAGASGSIRTWALSKIRDRAGINTGNSIGLSYLNEAQNGAYGNGTHRISSITYPTTVTGLGPFYRVRFAYSLRPTDDVVAGYRAGDVLRETNKLDTIVVENVANAATIKSYNLGYTQATVSSRLRLATVTECSASSCLRPTIIGYQAGARGWSPTLNTTSAVASPAARPLPVDLNGDGMTDLVYPVRATSTSSRWWVLFASAAGYGTAVDTGLTTINATPLLAANFGGKDRTQLLAMLGGYWSVVTWTGTGPVVSSTGLTSGGEFAAVDYDGDGLPDLVSRNGANVTVRRNTTVPGGPVTFGTAAEVVWTASQVFSGVGGAQSLTTFADFNGDGRGDLLVPTYLSWGAGFAITYWNVLYSNGFGGAATATALNGNNAFTPSPADWNADGCTDIVSGWKIYVSNCSRSFAEIAASGPTTASAVMAGDWDGDGRADLLYTNVSSNSWHVQRSTGEGMAASAATGIGAPLGSAWFVLDADGDGQVDLGYVDAANGNKIRYRLHNGSRTPPDLAVTFSDGFGINHTPDYISISAGNYTRHADAVFPEADFQSPLYVVRQVTAATGTGGTYQNLFQYYGARVNLQGRGFEGFHARRTFDTRDGLLTYDYAQRAFPYTGMHTQRSTWQGNGSKRIAEWSATVANQALGAGFEQRRFSFIATETDSRYEYGGILDGAPTSQATTSYTYGDGYGNATQVQTSIVDKDPYSPFFSSAWQRTLATTFTNDASSHCIGVPAFTTLTLSAPGQATQSRKTAYAVDTTACRVAQQILEPDTAALRVTTNFSFDDCGNVSSVQVIGASPSGSPLAARTTGLDHGPRCQLPESIVNALGHTTKLSYQYDFGVPTQWIDPNGVTTRMQYDDFGRRTLETRPDSTTTAWTFESCASGPCWNVNDLRFLVHETTRSATGETYDQREFFYDGFERLRQQGSYRVLGVWTEEIFAYDSLGRLVSQHHPQSSGTNGYTNLTYDALNRVTARKLYQASGVLDRATSFAYSGRTTRVTDALGRTRTHITDVLGRERRVIDPAPGGTTHLDYDSFGNLNRIEDPAGAISTGMYNARGFRTRWADADRGTWRYSANSLNELVAWWDAKGQSFSAMYDALGRMKSRAEPGASSTWIWGNSAAGHNIGRLQAQSNNGFLESLTYDSHGRLNSRLIYTDQPYLYDYTYNSQGALDTIAYPASPVPGGQSGSRFTVQYAYSYGEPVAINDVTQGAARPLWSLTAANDFSSPTGETLGAGAVTVASGYASSTNELTALQAGAGTAANNLQNLLYAWDAVGNLVQRQDLNQSLTETFTVDELDRVVGSTRNNVPTLTVAYDAAGNITSKSDVGQYTYGSPAHPHAVTAAGTRTFAYDANGDQVARNGLTQSWSSIGLPLSIVQPGAGGATFQSQFRYGPGGQRWRQISTYSNGTETTLYAGGLLEKESATSTGKTYWRHYVMVPGGKALVVSRNSDGTTSTHYILADHLGSSTTVVDASNNAPVHQSFTAFGARRGSDWSASTAPDWLGIANSTRHGYTSHEHLDNVGLIHMNGRVYDPVVGRFTSVDPLVGNISDSQAFNPYAYVGNRPLTFTDPSGHQAVPAPCVTCVFTYNFLYLTVLNEIFGASSGNPPPPATTLPGQSAQNGVGMCGPGAYSPTCTGMILYAGTPAGGSGEAATSTWTNEANIYDQDNFEQLLIDLGLNAVDVLVLGPYHDARSAYDAAGRGDYGEAVVWTTFTACEVVKPCTGVAAPFKGIVRAGKGAKRSGQAVRAATDPGTLVIGRGADLAKPGAVRAGEYKLEWPTKLPDWSAEWKENSRRMRGAMRSAKPIRDASPGDSKGPFLNAERILLKAHGWELDESTNYWMLPKP